VVHRIRAWEIDLDTTQPLDHLVIDLGVIFGLLQILQRCDDFAEKREKLR